METPSLNLLLDFDFNFENDEDLVVVANARKELKNLKRYLAERERQLSLTLAAMSQGKDISIFAVYNDRGEFVEITESLQTTSSQYLKPAKLCPLDIESF